MAYPVHTGPTTRTSPFQQSGIGPPAHGIAEYGTRIARPRPGSLHQPQMARAAADQHRAGRDDLRRGLAELRQPEQAAAHAARAGQRRTPARAACADGPVGRAPASARGHDPDLSGHADGAARQRRAGGRQRARCAVAGPAVRSRPRPARGLRQRRRQRARAVVGEFGHRGRGAAGRAGGDGARAGDAAEPARMQPRVHALRRRADARRGPQRRRRAARRRTGRHAAQLRRRLRRRGRAAAHRRPRQPRSGARPARCLERRPLGADPSRAVAAGAEARGRPAGARGCRQRPAGRGRRAQLRPAGVDAAGPGPRPSDPAAGDRRHNSAALRHPRRRADGLRHRRDRLAARRMRAARDPVAADVAAAQDGADAAAARAERVRGGAHDAGRRHHAGRPRPALRARRDRLAGCDHDRAGRPAGNPRSRGARTHRGSGPPARRARRRARFRQQPARYRAGRDPDARCAASHRARQQLRLGDQRGPRARNSAASPSCSCWRRSRPAS